MPQIKFQNIVSFSSEDKNFTADNLLKLESKKWKCESANEKQASVVIQLDKSVVIDKLEIGNEASAFIEVLVSRAESSNNEHTLLAVTSFMNPSESREKQNLNRVKIFNAKEHFENDVSKQKWDRVKVVCTQPFNKNIQYGLSFIKLYSAEPETKKAGIKYESDEEEEEEKEKTAPTFKAGVFQLKKDSSIKDDNSNDNEVKIGTTFSKWKEQRDKNGGGGEDKEDDEGYASKKAAFEKKISKTEEKEDKKQKAALNKKESKKEIKKDDQVEKKPTTTPKRKLTPEPSSDEDSKNSKKSKEDEKVKETAKNVEKDEKPKGSKPEAANNGGNKKTLLKGVVFAISGIQNPERGELRDKALQMGAKYRPDWDKDCTHLVCAFADTPKYVQVKKAGGIIVKKEWILECDKKSQKLDVKEFQFKETKRRDDSDDEDSDNDGKGRRATRKAAIKAKKTIKEFSDDEDIESENSEDREFVVDSSEEENDYKPSSSDDEETASSTSSEDSDEKKARKKKKKEKKEKKEKKKVEKKKAAKKASSDEKESEEDEDDDQWWNKKKGKSKKSKKASSSESEDDRKKTKKVQSKKKNDDSDEEKEEKKKKNGVSYEDSDDDKKPKPKPKAKTSAAKSSSSTEENSDMDIEKIQKKDLWELPDIFSNSNFFVYGNFNENERKNIKRIVVGYGGNLLDYISDKVDYVITDSDWNEEFDKSIKDNSKLKFISNDWLTACASRKKLIAYEPFQILPDV